MAATPSLTEVSPKKQMKMFQKYFPFAPLFLLPKSLEILVAKDFHTRSWFGLLWSILLTDLVKIWLLIKIRFMYVWFYMKCKVVKNCTGLHISVPTLKSWWYIKFHLKRGCQCWFLPSRWWHRQVSYINPSNQPLYCQPAKGKVAIWN